MKFCSSKKKYNEWAFDRDIWQAVEAVKETRDFASARRVIEMRCDAGYQYEKYERLQIEPVGDSIPRWAHSAVEQTKKFMEVLALVEEGSTDDELLQEAKLL